MAPTTEPERRVAREYFEALGRARARRPAALLRRRRGASTPPRRDRRRSRRDEMRRLLRRALRRLPGLALRGPRDRGRGRPRGGALARRAAPSPGRAAFRASSPTARGSTSRASTSCASRDGRIVAIDAYIERRRARAPARRAAAAGLGGRGAHGQGASTCARGSRGASPPAPEADRRRRLGRARRLPEQGDERLPRARRRRRDALRRRHQGDDDAVAAAGAPLGGITRVAARPRPPRPPRRGARPRRAGALPRRQPRRRRGRRRHALLRLREAQAVRQAGLPAACCAMWDGGPGHDRRHGRPRATRSPASRSSTCPATRPGLIGLWRAVRPPRARQRLLLHARPADRPPRPPARPPRAPSTTTPSRRAPRSASSPRWSPRPRGPATPTR